MSNPNLKENKIKRFFAVSVRNIIKIISKKKIITAAVKLSEEDLRLALEETLTSDDCEEIVSLGYSYDEEQDEEVQFEVTIHCTDGDIVVHEEM